MEKKQSVVDLFSADSKSFEFMPWVKGEKGRQMYLKLSKGGETALFYEGEDSVVQAENQRDIMKLVNDGWKVEGEVVAEFDGGKAGLSADLLPRHQITVEVGQALLPLLDPGLGSPLLAKLNGLREDLAKSLGFIVPGVNVRDNMLMPPNAYAIRIRGRRAASFELFLDRMMAIGPQEQLQDLTGWSVVEPTFRIPAKWIEPSERPAAESAGCMVQGALNVLLTHISDVITRNASEILGTQETYALLSDLSSTHPVLVSEFLDDVKSVRMIRKVLCGLLDEGVSLSDLVGIMETIGEHSDELPGTGTMVELVRRSLAWQICDSVSDPDGFIRAVVVEPELDRDLRGLVADELDGAFLKMSEEQEDKLSSLFRDAVGNQEIPPVVIASPAVRRHLRDFLVSRGIFLHVLSEAELVSGAKVTVVDKVKGRLVQDPPAGKPSGKKGAGVFWSRKIGRQDKKESR